VVLNWKAPVHSPLVPPATLLHVAVTADAGTVAHDVKFAAEAATVSAQVLAVAPPLVFQLTVAAELPGKLPRSGSVAVKLIVAGATAWLLMVVTDSGITMASVRIGTSVFFCAAARSDTTTLRTSIIAPGVLNMPFATLLGAADCVRHGRRIGSRSIDRIVRQRPRG